MLLWKVGYIAGFQRRFWWKSFYHRGTRDNPGRVLVLHYTGNKEEKLWGVAYEVDDVQWKKKIQEQIK